MFIHWTIIELGATLIFIFLIGMLFGRYVLTKIS